ncbi:MAG TPA: 50S ribosomal protein L18 [Patescibacteria group bacterium]|nr:50S ribosomal protein L18 [Patescibacteria group bacterium]
METKAIRYQQRKRRVRAKIVGTAARPRLSVFRSNAHIYGQLIDDTKQITLVSVSDLVTKKTGKMTKTEISGLIGEELAKLAIAKKIKKVTFDRNGFIYHGRIRAVADGARKGGLEF